MPEAKQITKPTPYATCADFQRIFHEDMNGLYLLSFLLAADREKAEQCFVSGLEDAVDGNPVFKEWARSWARRAIIQNAVRLISPRPAESNGSSHSASGNGDTPLTAGQEIDAVLALEPFDRFVYVLTILERYSDHECSVLLGCTRRDVLGGRTRALQQLGSAMEKHYSQLTSVSAQNATLRERGGSLLDLLVTSA